MSAPENGAQPCDLTLEEILCGPGGYTAREFEGGLWVREDVYEYASDFAYCLAERLERVLAEAERRGIAREVMEQVSDHRAAEPRSKVCKCVSCRCEKGESDG